ncbi:hypothetical protein BPIT_22740 [Candidatus Brocadia pituitae]|nr:hypothetical protein BPIT_22740 [Candidatus Brocadia pituitae]
MLKEGHAKVVIAPERRTNKVHPPQIPAYSLAKAHKKKKSRKGSNPGKIRLVWKDIYGLLDNKGGEDIDDVHGDQR